MSNVNIELNLSKNLRQMKKLFFYLFFICLFITHADAKTRKAVFIIVDGVPADQLER